MSRRDLLILAVFVYLLGHIIQAIANLFERLLDKSLGDRKKGDLLKNTLEKIVRGHEIVFLEKKMDREKQGTLPPEIIERVRETVSSYYKLDPSDVRKLKEKALNELCDAAVVANGAPEERDIYVYREGFYRGVSLALCFVALALLCPLARQLVVHDISVASKLGSWEPWPRAFAAAAFASYLGSCFAYFRYWRFRNYRIDGSFLFFLSLGKANRSLKA